MFSHNFKYCFKSLFRNKSLIFWTFMFPLILGTFFKMAFSNIEENEKLDIINIAVVNNEAYLNNPIYKEVMESLSEEENEDRLFNTSFVNEEEAKKLLDNDDIIGYLYITEEAKIVLKKNGINETIFKSVVESIEETNQIYKEILNSKINEYISTTNPEEINIEIYKNTIYENINKILNENNDFLIDQSNESMSYTMIEYYTLIAMTCLYGGMIGMIAINNLLPNMNNKGKRISISGVSKAKLVLSSALASYIIIMLGFLLLFIYTIFVLKVDYGSHLGLVILLASVGSVAGLSLGICLASVIKRNENVKIGITIAITMFGCFLSGMMGITMKYVIDKNIPLLNKINPASMITDGLYSLYYYDTFNRYIFNIVSLLIFAILMILISLRSLRRTSYDSI